MASGFLGFIIAWMASPFSKLESTGKPSDLGE